MDDEIRRKRLKQFDFPRGDAPLADNNTNHVTAGLPEMSVDAYRTGDVVDDTPQAQAVRAWVAGLSCAECRKITATTDAVLARFYVIFPGGQYLPSDLKCCKVAASVECFVLLAGFDRYTKHNKLLKGAPKAQPPPSAGSALANMMRGTSSLESNGVGYGGAESSDDYGLLDDPWETAGKGQRLGAPMTDQKSSATAQSLVDGDDRFAAGIMAAVATLVDDSSALPTLLLRGSILDRAADLLVNTSVDDITNRAALYIQLATFLRRLATCPTAAEVLHTPRAVNKTGHDLLRVATGLPTLTASDTLEKAQPLAHYMAGLNRQCKMMAKNSGMLDSESVSTLCEALKDAFNAVLIVETADTTPLESATETAQDNVADVLDYAILRNYSLTNAAQGMNGGVTKNRMKRITKEIIELSPNLPDGIFVRHGSTRPDCMKILIVAPKDTPYENGLFEFDLLLPADYPQKPPQMQFKTTGNGSFRFNPNLYADGKVCLSLLGTWSGPSWDPAKSSIFQVLVSIQAMIFCEHPWTNEPGREVSTEG